MNLATVLMCWNIPRISEELLYELFCNAGPIEEISFAKNGKSCSVVYEHADAVATAKDIFRDVKLDGRPLRIFDQEEITKIHSHQEEQVAYKQANASQNVESNESYELQRGGQSYPNYYRNMAPDYRAPRYTETDRRNSPYSKAASEQPAAERSNSMRYSSFGGGGHESAQSRPDLVPTANRPTKSRVPSALISAAIHDLANSVTDSFMNPYSTPLSRNAHTAPDHFARFPPASQDLASSSTDVTDGFANPYSSPVRRNANEMSDRYRSAQSDRSYNAGGRRSTDSQQEFGVDRYNSRQESRSRFDSNRSARYRDHPYREHQAEPYARGRFGSSAPAADYGSRHHSNSGERDRDHREQRKRGQRRY